jgi:hypothetical protein
MANDILNREQAEKALYPASGLPGGGQLEVRMEISQFHPDPDIRGVARRVKSFNLESWHKEWSEAAKKNEELAAGFEQENRKATAHEFYLRAADFYRRALVYMPDTDPRMLPTFKKLEENFTKAWRMAPAPFERVEIPYEGHMLPAHFWPGRGKPGARLPVVYNYGGADGILLRGEDGGAGQYVRRGMSFIDVDGPGHGGTLRYKKLYAPPDSERVAKAVHLRDTCVVVAEVKKHIVGFDLHRDARHFLGGAHLLSGLQPAGAIAQGGVLSAIHAAL